MLRLCSVVSLLLASGVLAAPAPVWRDPASPNTPYEAILAQLGKTRKAAGSCSKLGDTWELAAEKVAGIKLFQPVLTIKDGEGRIVAVSRAREGEFRLADGKKGAVLLLHFGEGVSQDGSECYFDARHFGLPLTGRR